MRRSEIIFPWNGHVQSQFVRAFRDRASAWAVAKALPTAHWVPNTDVYATDNGLVVKVELAGMRSDNLEITVEGNRLRISGNRPGRLPRLQMQFPGDGDQLRPV